MPVVDPLFWLGLSLLLVAISLTTVLLVAVPALRELGRACRSAEKLFDTLNRELPPTLDALRQTGLEITGLTDDVSESVQQAGRIVQQVDQGLSTAVDQAKHLQVGGRSAMAGIRAALTAWGRSAPRPKATKSSVAASRGQELRLRKPKRKPQSSGTPGDLRSHQNHSTASQLPLADGELQRQQPVSSQTEASHGLSGSKPSNPDIEAAPAENSSRQEAVPNPSYPLQEVGDD